MLPEDANIVLDLFASAEGGDVNAMAQLGTALMEGELGLGQNTKVGMRWLRKAAEGGSVDGQRGLAKGFLARGDHAAARKWYRRAAEQGDSWSMRTVADLLLTDQGGPRDAAEAAKWFARDGELHGRSYSMTQLANLLRAGDGGPRDAAAAAEWERRAEATSGD